MKHVEEIGRRLVYKGAIVDFYAMDVKLPDGKEEVWDLIHHRKGAACVLPVLEDGKLLMVRQYRPALGRMTIEVPAGAKDELSEDPMETAARELEEETGYRPGKIRPFMNLKSTVAFCDEPIDVYLAEELTKVGEQQLDEAEAIEVLAMDAEELKDMVFSGKIQDAKTVACIMAYFAAF